MLAKPLDYSKIFWQLQRWFPHDRRFNADNFGYQPEWLILEAYQAGSEMRREELHYQELAIAQLTQFYVNAHIDSKKTKPYSADSFYYFAAKNMDTQLSHECADAFFDLLKDNLVPQWVLAIAPLGQLKQQKTGFKPSYPRAAIGNDIIIINPVINNDSLTGSLAIVNEGEEEEWVTNAENTHQKLLIKIEEKRDFNGLYIISPQFDISTKHNWA